MNARLTHNTYGKHRVRVSKIKRDASDPSKHQLIEATVNVLLEGDLDEAYTKGDNSKVVATDTCKNTVYLIAKEDPFDTIESFGARLAKHFLDQYSHLTQVRVELREHTWRRLLDCPHAFHGSDGETPTASIRLVRGQEIEISAGIDDLVIAKTTQSGFANFHRDEYRTLPDTDDRILATSVTAQWTYSDPNADFVTARQSIRSAMLAKFIDHYSKSVQQTLMLMGQAALEACDAIDAITLSMPNKHHILFNMKPFDRENHNEVFIVTDEPAGFIHATITRDS